MQWKENELVQNDIESDILPDLQETPLISVLATKDRQENDESSNKKYIYLYIHWP